MKYKMQMDNITLFDDSWIYVLTLKRCCDKDGSYFVVEGRDDSEFDSDGLRAAIEAIKVADARFSEPIEIEVP